MLLFVVVAGGRPERAASLRLRLSYPPANRPMGHLSLSMNVTHL